MRDYDEFDEERDLKNIKKESNMTEFGDRLNKSDICNGVILLTSIAGLFLCACARGCQEVKKHMNKDKVPAAQVITNAVQNVR